jgi:hypothetical protein
MKDHVDVEEMTKDPNLSRPEIAAVVPLIQPVGSKVGPQLETVHCYLFPGKNQFVSAAFFGDLSAHCFLFLFLDI